MAVKGRHQEKKIYCEGACGHMVVKGRHQAKKIYCEGACGHMAVKGRHQAKKKFIVKVLMATRLWKEGIKKKKNYCEGACGHMALWNFRLRFEPLSLLPLTGPKIYN